MLENIVVLFIILAIVAGALVKIISDKQKGIHCTGCPHSKSCASATACPHSPGPGKT
jgi:hypothetical protein